MPPPISTASTYPSEDSDADEELRKMEDENAARNTILAPKPQRPQKATQETVDVARPAAAHAHATAAGMSARPQNAPVAGTSRPVAQGSAPQGDKYPCASRDRARAREQPPRQGGSRRRDASRHALPRATRFRARDRAQEDPHECPEAYNATYRDESRLPRQLGKNNELIQPKPSTSGSQDTLQLISFDRSARTVSPSNLKPTAPIPFPSKYRQDEPDETATLRESRKRQLEADETTATEPARPKMQPPAIPTIVTTPPDTLQQQDRQPRVDPDNLISTYPATDNTQRARNRCPARRKRRGGKGKRKTEAHTIPEPDINVETAPAAAPARSAVPPKVQEPRESKVPRRLAQTRATKQSRLKYRWSPPLHRGRRRSRPLQNRRRDPPNKQPRIQ
ncbi:hypothetical protein ACJJTC_002023 [Scirpophaga incertulas]